jgi:hypothetical protein
MFSRVGLFSGFFITSSLWAFSEEACVQRATEYVADYYQLHDQKELFIENIKFDCKEASLIQNIDDAVSISVPLF